MSADSGKAWELGSEPAYPIGPDGPCAASTAGLTKRELFAAMNCAALLGGDKPCGGDVERVAVLSADRLLAALAEPQS